MKKTKIFNGLVITTLLINFTAVSASAAGATSWSCISDKVGLTASYEESMFGETLTVIQSRRKNSSLTKTYYVNDSATPAPGSRMLLQDDPSQEGLQQKVGTYAAELAEILLTGKDKLNYDMGFQFQGANFLCTRD